MKVLVTFDSFKDCLSADEVGMAVINGLSKERPGVMTTHIPLADGGEGSLRAINIDGKYRRMKCAVVDPLLRPITSWYLADDENSTAYIEMASASGIELLTPEERDCFRTSTYGTGLMMLDAWTNGLSRIVLFIGGSATSDMGIGMAAALGVEFFDSGGDLIDFPRGCHLDEIEDFRITENLAHLKVTVVCDVENPLFGPEGASFTYGPQKGGNLQSLTLLDEGMKKLNKKLTVYSGKDFSQVKGAGAAGGIGAMCMYLFETEMVKGVDFLFGILNIETAIRNCDLVITGEGKMDFQTLHGKLLSGIGALAKKHKKYMIAICGNILLSEKDWRSLGINEVYSLAAITNYKPYTAASTRQLLKKIGYKIGEGLLWKEA